MSVNIKIRDAVKRYGDFTAVSGLSLDIKEGEFFTLLGPSGCGKTTLLRMIAGFNSIEGGDFYFEGKRINDLDPAKRNIGMVFQNYAIFPHLTVEKNVAFGLQNRKLDKETIKTETQKYLDLMHIGDFAKRMPENLSGGQQQRVALARALVINPDVLLMDEPLSNLDAKLRVEMRTVIKDIQSSVGITTVYVTHDQEEAMAVSDRIAIMDHGVFQQIGTPKAIYQRPSNLFVASFIGQTNIIEGKLVLVDKKTMIEFKGGYQLEMDNILDNYKFDQDVVVSIRPEEFQIVSNDTGLVAMTDNSAFLGHNTNYYVTVFDGQRVKISQESTIEEIIEEDSQVFIYINTAKINVFTADGKINIVKGVSDDNAQYLTKERID
ncbi:MAG: ABC transporter ATP-binding protein [Erysipelothrix sp.]|nr:ABC transporter ATP-binding protein [Erysipelothrix sp.]